MSKELVLIQVRVPPDVHARLVELQVEARQLYLAAYCRQVLIDHVKANPKKTKARKR